jgi:hypothetical protein
VRVYFGRTIINSTIDMGRGKAWSKTESLHLAQAWVAVSEGDGAQKVAGTSQTQEEFWRGVMEIFSKKAPEQTLPGTYTNREWTALRNHWSDSLSRDVKKFRRSLNKVYARNLSGCSEQDKVNIAVAMHRGLSDDPDYRLAIYDPSLWKFYECWLSLRNHPAFRFETTKPSAVAASLHSVASTSSLDAADSVAVDGEDSIDDEFKKKRIKFNDDFLVILKQRQKIYSDYVSSIEQHQLFKNAAIGYELFKDSDPEEASKYKNMMFRILSTNSSNIMTNANESANETNNTNEESLIANVTNGIGDSV